MKGPLRTVRDGDAALHRAAIALTKAARLVACGHCAGCADPRVRGSTYLTLVSAERPSIRA